MSTPKPTGKQLFKAAGVPTEAFLAMSWASVLSMGSPATNLQVQYGSHLPWCDVAKHTAHSLHICNAFHHINQSWLVHPLTMVVDTPQTRINAPFALLWKNIEPWLMAI